MSDDIDHASVLAHQVERRQDHHDLGHLRPSHHEREVVQEAHFPIPSFLATLLDVCLQCLAEHTGVHAGGYGRFWQVEDSSRLTRTEHVRSMTADSQM